MHKYTNDRWLNPAQIRDRLELTRSKYQVERKKVDYLKLNAMIDQPSKLMSYMKG